MISHFFSFTLCISCTRACHFRRDFVKELVRYPFLNFNRLGTSGAHAFDAFDGKYEIRALECGFVQALIDAGASLSARGRGRIPSGLRLVRAFAFRPFN